MIVNCDQCLYSNDIGDGLTCFHTDRPHLKGNSSLCSTYALKKGCRFFDGGHTIEELEQIISNEAIE